MSQTQDEDLKAKMRELQSITDTNTRKYKRLQREFGLQLDPGSMAAARLEMLIDRVLGKNTHERLDLEIAWQTAMDSTLAQAESEAVRKKLSNGRIIRP